MGILPRRAPEGLHGRRPNPQHHRVRSVHRPRAASTAWCISPTSTGTKAGDEAIKDYKKGQTVKVTVLDVDSQKERISAGHQRSSLVI